MTLLQAAVLIAVTAILAATIVPDLIERTRGRLAQRAAQDVVSLQDGAKRYFLASAAATTPGQRRWPGQTDGTREDAVACVTGTGVLSPSSQLLSSGAASPSALDTPWGGAYALSLDAAAGCALVVTAAVPARVARLFTSELPAARCDGSCPSLVSVPSGSVLCCSRTPKPGSEAAVAHAEEGFEQWIPSNALTDATALTVGPGNPFGNDCSAAAQTNGGCPEGTPYCRGCTLRTITAVKGEHPWKDLREEAQCLCGFGEATCAGSPIAVTCPPPACTPTGSCSGTKPCGELNDGCTRFHDCGTCVPPEYCGGGGVPGACGCTPLSCASAGRTCGPMDDGCGATVSCGGCAAGWSCAVSGNCVCAPRSCAAQGRVCGPASDGCGASLDCGGCPAGTTCDAAGQCVCAPTTCAALGRSCGTAPDGCGKTLSCGNCSPGWSCSAAGTCVCQPRTCAQLGRECGSTTDGCGNTLSCGGCADGYACRSGQCEPDPPSLSHSCSITGRSTDPSAAYDGCIISCTYTYPVRGATGYRMVHNGGSYFTSNGSQSATFVNPPTSSVRSHVEVTGPWGTASSSSTTLTLSSSSCGPRCTPKTCASLGKSCGSWSNGCGGTLSCGGCPSGKECDSGRCVCKPKTCSEMGKSCGSWSDGCGGTVSCGSCGSTGNLCTQYTCSSSGTCTVTNKAQGTNCQTSYFTCGNGASRSYACRVCNGSGSCVLNTPHVNGSCTPSCGTIAGLCGGAVCCSSCVREYASSDCNHCCQATSCAPVCRPMSCGALGKSCGSWGDGCGGSVYCGGCTGRRRCINGACR